MVTREDRKSQYCDDLVITINRNSADIAMGHVAMLASADQSFTLFRSLPLLFLAFSRGFESGDGSDD